MEVSVKSKSLYILDYVKNCYRLEFSSSIRQLIGLGGLFCQLNGSEQESLITMI